MNYKDFPKVELHLHLDCSLSFKALRQLSPSATLEEYEREYVLPHKCADLVDYVNRANKGAALMQTREQLQLVTQDLYDQLAEDNVVYAEIRFAPHLHLEGGMTPEEVVECVVKAADDAIKRTGIEGGVILCTLRHYSEERSLEVADLVRKFKATRVVGLDIAADEKGHPVDNHIKAFRHAKKHHINCTAHAGEARGPESVWETLSAFAPARIGHGVRSVEDKTLLDHLKDRRIHLEICPTSNVQTNVYDRLEDHRLDEIYRYGVSMSINTDARAISGTTLAGEYEKLNLLFGWRLEHFKRCNLEAIAHAFASDDVKDRVRKLLEQAYSKVR